ncbi:unnamed protein product [Mesocestoides corti]|uniref:BHLH domain-containing protein n=1 Tax=Mesocestoides corti TaxID=53468 RepID=A0A0R3UIC4_MESCO|nr:unnamed protein product [Mesocestoides corti]
MFYDWTTLQPQDRPPHQFCSYPGQFPIKVESGFEDQAEAEKRGRGAENHRNERERLRVKQVNAAFALLRDHLPAQIQGEGVVDKARRSSRRSQRVSKVRTLRAAIRYIEELIRILQMSETEEHSNIRD